MVSHSNIPVSKKPIKPYNVHLNIVITRYHLFASSQLITVFWFILRVVSSREKVKDKETTAAFWERYFILKNHRERERNRST
jgi:hypothetical protein